MRAQLRLPKLAIHLKWNFCNVSPYTVPDMVSALDKGIGDVGAGAAGAAGRHWRWTNHSMEPVPHLESFLLVFTTVLDSGGYVFLQSQPQSQPPPQTGSASNTTGSY